MEEAGPASTDNLTCMRCGYSLKTIPFEGVCPECGLAVEATVQCSHFRYRDSDWLKRLKTGTTLAKWGSFAVLLLLSSFLTERTRSLDISRIEEHPLPGCLMVCCALCVFSLGAWFLTSREPDSVIPESDGFFRKATRVTLIIALGLTAMMLASLLTVEEATLTDDSSRMSSGEFSVRLVIGAVLLVLAMLCFHLGTMARGFGKIDLSRRTHFTGFLFLCIVVIGAVWLLDLFPMGSVCSIMSWVFIFCLILLIRFKMTLNAIRESIEEALVTPTNTSEEKTEPT